MMSIQEQINAQKETKQERLKELFYVDYCYHCKDSLVRADEVVSCHHPWYCHHDEGEVQELEGQIGLIRHWQWLRGYVCAYEIKQLKELRSQKWELIKKGRRELQRIKH